MRLAGFILENIEDILKQWETFARTIQPADGKMSTAALRDHAEAMLKVIAADLGSPQTERESIQKSRGNGPKNPAGTAAESHADERLKSGFSIALMVAEYRALRATVLRLWLKNNKEYTETDSSDMIRFNEAIDQALAESVENYGELVIESQDIFLGILGHDLRSPLQSVSLGAAYLMRLPDGDSKMIQLGARMYNSAARMTGMLDDLLDFTKIRIGGGLQITRASTDFASICAQVIEEFLVTHPGRAIRSSTAGNCIGNWDGGRIGQVCQNLIGNALQYSASDTAVEIALTGGEDDVVLSVRNHGPPIPESVQNNLFDPLRRHVANQTAEALPTRNLGLGLYIAKEVVMAHHGTIGLKSTEAEGTTFTVTLPKSSSLEAGKLLSRKNR
ncbi:MAG TPA: sensor histidine kinase [Pseudomonadales bacterium]